MKIYDENGYLNIKNILSAGQPFTFVVGGRGIGKTYTALRDAKMSGSKFMFLRRTQSQVDIIGTENYNPFKTLNADFGWNVRPRKQGKYIYSLVDCPPDQDGKPEGVTIGYMVALSTMSNLRGFDASDVKTIIFDEFIPERHERPIKNQGVALLNAYETINRNRELKGCPPVQLLALANSNNLANPIFVQLGLVLKAEKMQKAGQNISIIKDRGIMLVMPHDSRISSDKHDTALYKAASGSNDFVGMSLGNDFSDLNNRFIQSKPLREYKPVLSIGQICIYKHKNKNEWYVSGKKSGSPMHFTTSASDLQVFRATQTRYWAYYLDGKIIFESFFCYGLFTKYYRM